MVRESGTRIELRYSLALGALLGALGAITDVFLTAHYGRRVPWAWPAVVLAAYMVAGSLCGVSLAFIEAAATRAGWLTAATDRHARLREWTFVAWSLAVGGLVCITLVTAEITVGIVGTLFALYVFLTIYRGVRLTSGRTFSWQVMTLAVLLIGWRSVRAAYVDIDPENYEIQPAVAYATYFAVVIAVYLVGAWLFGKLPGLMRIDTLVRCTTHAGVAATLVMAVGLTVVGYHMPYPIDQPHPRPTESRATARPNIILMALDTVRADHLSAYDYHRPTTPNLAALAQDAEVYDLAISTSSWTLPAHASMLTGELPSTHGAHFIEAATSREIEEALKNDGAALVDVVAYRLAEERVTLAEILGAHGYSTAAVVSNAGPLQRAFQLCQGFDYYDDRTAYALRSVDPRLKTPAGTLFRIAREWWAPVTTEAARTAPEINRDIIAWLDRNPPQPFFLFLNYNDAHTPYTPRVGPDLGPLDPPTGLGNEWRSPVYPDYRDKLETYDSELVYLDHHIGKLFDELKRRNLYDNTLIIVTADHGEAFGEHDCFEHGKSLYQPEVWVPLIIRYPGDRQRGRIAEPTSTARLFNVALKEAGLVHDQMRLSAAPAQPAGDSPDHTAQHLPYAADVVAELWPRWTMSGSPHPGGVMCAVVTREGLKAIRDSDDRVQAYDVFQDPLELDNLLPVNQEFAAWAQTWLSEWAGMMRASEPEAGDMTELDEELQDHLRALGYIQ